jgi:hypothetical protein
MNLSSIYIRFMVFNATFNNISGQVLEWTRWPHVWQNFACPGLRASGLARRIVYIHCSMLHVEIVCVLSDMGSSCPFKYLTWNIIESGIKHHKPYNKGGWPSHGYLTSQNTRLSIGHSYKVKLLLPPPVL